MSLTKLGVVIGGCFVFVGCTESTPVSPVTAPLTPWFTIGGPSCSVPGDYPTIQAAVSDAGCATINVAPGSYPENVAIARSLVLNGARAGVDARTRSGSESTINGSGPNIRITANNVTVDGFTLVGPVSQGSAAIDMPGGNSGETIRNNIVQDPGRAVSYNTSATTFSRNLILESATTGDGIQQNSGTVSGVTIADNKFSGGFNNNADITFISDPAGSSNIRVTGNSSVTPGTLVALFYTNGAVISGNTVVNPTGSAIYIGGGDNNVVVSGNNISGGAFSAVKVANAFGDGPNSAISVTENTLTNNAYGVNVAAGSIILTETVQVHRNLLSGNSLFGINNTSTGAVAGTCNWWGSKSGPGPVGPGSGDKVSTGVTYSPWLTSAQFDAKCKGGKDKDEGEDAGDGN